MGYKDALGYFYGINSSACGPSLNFGWAGHAEGSGTFGTVEEILEKVRDKKIEEIIKYVYVWTRDGFAIDIPFEYLNASRVNYPNNCRSLELSKIQMLKEERIQQLVLNIGHIGNYEIEINLSGKTLDCRRPIKEHSLHSTGDSIRLVKENVTRAYMVEIGQRIFVEEDPTNACRDYPNKDYLSYEQCDDHFVRSLLPGLTPIWLTDDLSEVSTQIIDENGTYGELL